jgi:hypothetical protein
VAGVVVAGIVGTIVLVLLIRPRAPEALERPPVTLRSPGVAEVSPLPVSPVPVTPATLPEPVTPTTLSPVVPNPPPTTRASALPVAPYRPATTMPRAAETTLAPAPTTVAPEPAPVHPAAPAVAAFPGAGKVDLGEKFYEKTLTYSTDDTLAFEGHVGPIKVPTVRFVVGEKKGRFGKIDVSRLSVRAVFPAVECPKDAGEWDYSFQVELLDEKGQRLDRLGDSGSCENQTKVVVAEGGVLKSLVPSIKGVKIRLQAAKD